MAHLRELNYTPEQIAFLEKIQHDLQTYLHNFITKHGEAMVALKFDTCDITEHIAIAYAAVFYDRVIRPTYGEKLTVESAQVIAHAFGHLEEGWQKLFTMIQDPEHLLKLTPVNPNAPTEPPKEAAKAEVKQSDAVPLQEVPKEEPIKSMDAAVPPGVTWQ